MKTFNITIYCLILVVQFFVFNFLLISQPKIEWQRSLGGIHNEEARSIQQTNDGGFVVAGYTQSNDGDVIGNHGGWDAWIIKLDALGNLKWQKCFGGSNDDYAFSIQQTNDDGYIVAGYTKSNDSNVVGNHGGWDAWILKLDTIGNIQWQKCLGGSACDIAYLVQQTNDGGLIVAGETESNNGDVIGNHGGKDAWVVNLDSRGEVKWQKCLGGSVDDVALSIQQTIEGGFIVSGDTQSDDGDVRGHQGSNDGWIIKLDTIGNIQWQECLGGQYLDFNTFAQQTNDSGFIVGGITMSESRHGNYSHMRSDIMIEKMDLSGKVKWLKWFGGSGDDYAYSLQQTHNGNLIITGFTDSYDGDVKDFPGSLGDFWIFNIDLNGVMQWQRCLGGSSKDWAFSIKQTIDDGFIIVGYSFSNDGDVSSNHGLSDVWVVKLSAETVVDEYEQNADFSLSPNPATDFIEISGINPMLKHGVEDIRIYNVLGEELKNLTPALCEGEGARIDVSALPASLYFVRVGDKVGKFLKI